MKNNPIYLIGLLAIGMHCAHADAPSDAPDGQVATADFFFISPDGGATTDDEVPTPSPNNTPKPEPTPSTQQPKNNNSAKPSTPPQNPTTK